MDIIKTYKICLLVVLSQLLLGSGCNKNATRPCPNSGYSFAANSAWSPEQEIYHVGDTIFIYSEIPKLLTDLINPAITTDFSNATGISGSIGMGYLDTISRQVIPARDSFLIISQTGTISERSINPTAGIIIGYEEKNLNYQLKIGFVCKKRGIYGFSISSVGSTGIRGKNCTNATFDMNVTNTEKNLHLHQYVLGVNPNDPVLQKVGYDFRVQ